MSQQVIKVGVYGVGSLGQHHARVYHELDETELVGVYDVDANRAGEIAGQIRTGVVAVNSAAILDMASPFGGFKKSGIGRELGPEGFGPFTEIQSVLLPA